jgi:hypothetical protein
MSFSDSLQADIEKRKQGADKAVRAIMLEAVNRIVLRSPVGDAIYWKSPPPKGYVGGRFRNAWQHAIGHVPAAQEPNNPKASGEDSIARVSQGVAAKPSSLHYIFNNLPYALRIENGWSEQAPRGIVSLVRAEWDQISKVGKNYL